MCAEQLGKIPVVSFQPLHANAYAHSYMHGHLYMQTTTCTCTHIHNHRHMQGKKKKSACLYFHAWISNSHECACACVCELTGAGLKLGILLLRLPENLYGSSRLILHQVSVPAGALVQPHSSRAVGASFPQLSFCSQVGSTAQADFK